MKKSYSSSNPIKRLFSLLSLEQRDLTLVYAYAILGGVIGLSIPLGIQAIMNLMVAEKSSSAWYVLISLIVVGITFVGVVQILQISIMERIQQRIMVKASFDLAFRAPRWKVEAIMKEYAPELMNRFFDVLGIQKGLAKILVSFLSAFLQVIFAILLLALYHSYFAIYGLLLFSIALLIFRYTFRKGLETSLKESSYKYKIAAWLEELGRTMGIVKLAGDTTMHLTKTDKIVSEWVKWRKKHFQVLMFQFGVIVTFKTLITGGLLVIGGYLVFINELTLGQFVASEITIILIIGSVEKLIEGIEIIYDVLTSVEKLGIVMDIEMEDEHGISFEDIDTGKGVSIEFDKVSYKFPNNQLPALSELKFKIESGEKVCIAGLPGSGKTTLINMAATLYHDYQGHISFNGVSTKNLNLISLRSYVGENLAKKDLIQGTIADNISMGRDDISYQDIKKAADAVGLTDYIQKTEFGFETMVVPEDITISSSVITKIAMARSIAENPHLYLLDSFLLNLKNHDKELIINALTGNDKPWTLLATSNDLMFAKKCDRIIVLEEGKIIGQGTFDYISQQDYFEGLFH